MLPLKFPSYDFKVQDRGGSAVVFDAVREKWIPLLPEEWVRLHTVQYLIKEKGVPAGLIGIEKAFKYKGMQRRADVIVHDRQGRPVLMVECKAPSVKIDQSVFDQVARYNLVIHARYLFVTNGLQHYCCEVDREKKAYTFLEDLPDYTQL